MKNRIQIGNTRRYILIVSLLLAVGVGGLIMKEVTPWTSPLLSHAFVAPDSGVHSDANRRSAPRSKAPLPFEPNAGQADPRVSFVARSRVGTLFFTTSGVDLALGKPVQASNPLAANSIDSAPSESDTSISATTDADKENPATRMHLRFLDANPAATVNSGALLPGKANYLVGKDPSKWLTDLDTYSSITYKDLYPGVTLVYSGTAGDISASYTIAPGSDPTQIRWSVEGAKPGIEASGGIRLLPVQPQPSASSGSQESAIDSLTGSIGLAGQTPVAWQSLDGQRSDVTARYKLGEDGTLSLELGKYDASSPLTVTSRLAYIVAPPADPAISAGARGQGQQQGQQGQSSASAPAPLTLAPGTGPGTSNSTSTGTGTTSPSVFTPTILGPYPQVVSRPLRDIPPIMSPGDGSGKDETDEERQPPPPAPITDSPPFDPIVQNWAGPQAMPAPINSFDGIQSDNSMAPPDTNGDIGPRHYIQYINTFFRIYNRDGTKLYPPDGQPAAAGNALWRDALPTGSICGGTNRGDPIVQYDQLADRWFMSQFAYAGPPNHPIPPFYQCLAVSKGPDPTDSWYVSEVPVSNTRFNDYPKFGIWPDAYYMSLSEFIGDNYVGPSAVAFDRAALLAGQPYRAVKFELTQDENLLLPSDLDGELLPPPGAPNVFATFEGAPSSLHLYHFSVNWADPMASTFTGPTILRTAPFDPNLCMYGPCIPQVGTNRKLDTLSGRPMYRLTYRNMGNYESLLMNHTVDADGTDHAAIRWYEIRDPFASPAIFQQSTYAPDGDHRWMGSIAMDHVGNIALAYSLAGDSLIPIPPSIAYSGRLVTDTLGTLPQAETILQGGGGVQTGTERWGDYSSLSLDPVDDCTFWYTQEYYAASSPIGWSTRIGSFKFPSCGAAYSTYQGGSFDDSATSIALDNAGNLYVTGNTFSTNFYTPTNPYQPASAGGRDAFISTLAPDGSLL